MWICPPSDEKQSILSSNIYWFFFPLTAKVTQHLELYPKEGTLFRSYFLFACQRKELILSLSESSASIVGALHTASVCKEACWGQLFLQFPETLLKISIVKTEIFFVEEQNEKVIFQTLTDSK